MTPKLPEISPAEARRRLEWLEQFRDTSGGDDRPRPAGTFPRPPDERARPGFQYRHFAQANDYFDATRTEVARLKGRHPTLDVGRVWRVVSRVLVTQAGHRHATGQARHLEPVIADFTRAAKILDRKFGGADPAGNCYPQEELRLLVKFFARFQAPAVRRAAHRPPTGTQEAIAALRELGLSRDEARGLLRAAGAFVYPAGR